MRKITPAQRLTGDLQTEIEKPPYNQVCGPQRPRSNRTEIEDVDQGQIANLTAVALIIIGSVASTSTPAEAHSSNHYSFNHHDFNHYGWGIGAGLASAAIVGSAIAANDGYNYGGYHYCRWVPRFDVYGNYIGRSAAAATDRSDPS